MVVFSTNGIDNAGVLLLCNIVLVADGTCAGKYAVSLTRSSQVVTLRTHMARLIPYGHRICDLAQNDVEVLILKLMEELQCPPPEIVVACWSAQVSEVS